MLEDDDSTDMAQLIDGLQNIAENNFLTQFGYSYNGDRSMPSDLSTADGTMCKGHEDFITCKVGDSRAITNYVDNTTIGYGPPWSPLPNIDIG